MAKTKNDSATKQYKIKVKNNPNFCGKGAGGVQFAYGEAVLPGCRMVEWFREHEGYEVTEVEGGSGSGESGSGE